MNILALDPGSTTGWASFDGEFEQGVISLPGKEMWADKDVGELEVSILWADVVVVEDFWLRPDLAGVQSGSHMDAAQVIGWVKGYLCLRALPLPTLVFQAPVKQAKQLWTDDLLRANGLYDRIKGGQHARSAMRHLLTYLNSQKHPIIREMLARYEGIGAARS